MCILQSWCRAWTSTSLAYWCTRLLIFTFSSLFLQICIVGRNISRFNFVLHEYIIIVINEVIIIIIIIIAVVYIYYKLLYTRLYILEVTMHPIIYIISYCQPKNMKRSTFFRHNFNESSSWKNYKKNKKIWKH